MSEQMRKVYTVQDLAGSENLWMEYVDPDNNANYHSMTKAEREQMIREIWPDTREVNPEQWEDDNDRKFWKEMLGF